MNAPRKPNADEVRSKVAHVLQTARGEDASVMTRDYLSSDEITRKLAALPEGVRIEVTTPVVRKALVALIESGDVVERNEGRFGRRYVWRNLADRARVAQRKLADKLAEALAEIAAEHYTDHPSNKDDDASPFPCFYHERADVVSMDLDTLRALVADDKEGSRLRALVRATWARVDGTDCPEQGSPNPCGQKFDGVFPARYCSLPKGHACRHEDGPLAWTDADVLKILD